MQLDYGRNEVYYLILAGIVFFKKFHNIEALSRVAFVGGATGDPQTFFSASGIFETIANIIPPH